MLDINVNVSMYLEIVNILELWTLSNCVLDNNFNVSMNIEIVNILEFLRLCAG